MKTRNFFMYFTGVKYKFYTECKKTSNLIKDTSSHNTCSVIKSQQVKKLFVIQCQKLLIFPRLPLFFFMKSLLTIQFHVCF